MPSNEENISFSFGKNWKSYLKQVSEKEIEYSIQDIRDWIGDEIIPGKSILDIGSGSGLHSLAFIKLGAKHVDSFDYDIHSVEATKQLWITSNKPENWKIFSGSVLDSEFMNNLPEYDIVYSWGVLHHTGDMWTAIKNAASHVKPGGYFWISIYAKGPRYQADLALKRKYNKKGKIGKNLMELKMILIKMGHQCKVGENPFCWNKTYDRGMNVYHDIVDWLGGLPYEVATVSEVNRFCKNLGFSSINFKESREGGCSIYLFQRDF